MKQNNGYIPKLLLIEDDILLNKLLTSFLYSLGYTVRNTHDGAEAIELYNNQTPDLVLLDLNIPKINGHQLLKEVLRVPVIVITGEGHRENEIRSFQNGATLFHPKPIDTQLLKVQVESILNRGVTKYPFDIEINHESRQICLGEISTFLTPKEFLLFMRLLDIHPNILTIERLTNPDEELFSNIQTLQTCITRLRRSLDKSNFPLKILNIRGHGYRLAG